MDRKDDDFAAQGAAKGAAHAVPQNDTVEITVELHVQLLTLKRRIAGSRSLQKRLIDGITSAEEFHQRLVEIGAEHGVTLTPADSHAFLMQRAALGDAEVPDPPPPSSLGHTCESTCSANPYDHNCSYPPSR